MAIINTKISDLVPSEKALNVAVNLLLAQKNVLINSGLTARGPEVDAVAGGGPRKSSLAYINPLSTDEVNVSTDVITDEGNIGLMTADEFTVLRHDLNYGWGFTDLQRMVTQYDAQGGVRAGIAQYWNGIYTKLLVSTLKGAKASVNALTGAAGLATKAAIIKSVSSDFDMAAVYDAAATAGDYADQYNVLIISPARYAKLQAKEANGFVPLSRTNTGFAEYQGYSLIKSTNVDNNDVIVARTGAVAFGEGNPAGMVPIELERRANGGNGGGADILHSRRSVVVHPQGMEYKGVVPGKTTNIYTNLEAAATWGLEVPQEMFGFRFLTFNAA
jgi:hypothetical protein